MGSHNLYRGIGVFFLILGITVLGLAGEPTERIKKTTDRILSIVGNPVLKDSSRAKERKKLMRSAVDEQFDWEEMARRSLGRHWDQRTHDEKKEFVRLFADLLDRTYMNKVEGYSGEKVQYEGETVDGNHASVKVKIVTQNNKDISVEYRVKKEKNDWLVYDVLIESVSLVNNYRTQFNSIILQSSYENLVKKLREKTTQD